MVGAAIRGAGTLRAMHSERNGINEGNLEALGLSDARNIDESVLKGEGWEKSKFNRKVFHDKGTGNRGNQRWVLKDPTSGYTGTELIVDVSGTRIVNQSWNAASFNYSTGGIIGHIVKDVLPYFVWGNSANDPTNMLQRIGRTFEGPRRSLFESPSAYGQ